VERKHVARYWLINTAATAVPLSAHPFPLVTTMKLTAAILGGGGVVRRRCSAAQYCPCAFFQRSINRWNRLSQDKLMLRQSMDSRTVYREEDDVRWTSSWTSCPQVQSLHETVSVIDWSSIRLIVPEMQPHPVSTDGHNYRYVYRVLLCPTAAL